MTITVTLADKLACLRRELALRKSAYPKFVEKNRMSQGQATLEITIMAAILADYESLNQPEK
jgi:hypothetical protein